MDVTAQIPESLVTYPCEPVGPGTNTTHLSKAYIKNVTCIGEYKTVIDGLKTYNQGIKSGNERLKQQSNGSIKR